MQSLNGQSNYIDPQSESDELKTCNCKKSNCLKLYCECFAFGVHCVEYRCNCVACYNNVRNESRRSHAVMATLERNPNAFRSRITEVEDSRRFNKGCHCKKSNCLKKYCECFQGKIYCSDQCRCKDCYNHVNCPNPIVLQSLTNHGDSMIKSNNNSNSICSSGSSKSSSSDRNSNQAVISSSLLRACMPPTYHEDMLSPPASHQKSNSYLYALSKDDHGAYSQKMYYDHPDDHQATATFSRYQPLHVDMDSSRQHSGNDENQMQELDEQDEEYDCDQDEDVAEDEEEDGESAFKYDMRSDQPPHPGMSKLSRLLTDKAITNICHNLLAHMRDDHMNKFSNSNSNEGNNNSISSSMDMQNLKKASKLEQNDVHSIIASNIDRNTGSGSSISDHFNNTSSGSGSSSGNSSNEVLLQAKVVSIITEFGVSCDREVAKNLLN